jgi:hypothetical protein
MTAGNAHFIEKSLYAKRKIWASSENKTLKKSAKIALFMLIPIMIAASASLVAVMPANAQSLVWQGDVSSSGASVTTPTLQLGVTYEIVASQAWWYNYPSNLAADAQYYTTNSSDSWDWYNYYKPGTHSFLQINGTDVDWGPFSNGDTGHTYTIYFMGQGGPIILAIVDWVDQNYANNHCHLQVDIYCETTVGGRVVDSSPQNTNWLIAVGALLLTSAAIVPVVIHVKKK